MFKMFKIKFPNFKPFAFFFMYVIIFLIMRPPIGVIQGGGGVIKEGGRNLLSCADAIRFQPGEVALLVGSLGDRESHSVARGS